MPLWFEPNRPRAAPHAARIRPRCSGAEPLRPRVPSAAEVIPAGSVAGAFASAKEYFLTTCDVRGKLGVLVDNHETGSPSEVGRGGLP